MYLDSVLTTRRATRGVPNSRSWLGAGPEPGAFVAFVNLSAFVKRPQVDVTGAAIKMWIGLRFTF